MNAFTRGKKNLFIPDLLQNDMSKAQNLQELPSVAVFFLTVVHTNFCVNVLIALCWCNTKCIQLNPHLSNFTNCQFTHTRSQPNLYFQAHFHMWYTNIWCRKNAFHSRMTSRLVSGGEGVKRAKHNSSSKDLSLPLLWWNNNDSYCNATLFLGHILI